MTVTHVVLFQISTKIDASAVSKITRDFLALKEKCINLQTKEPYIVSLTGGKDISKEGLQGGLNYGFVVEFKSVEDRDYYVNNDPAHQDFVKSIDGKVGEARVIDYEPGTF